MISKKWLLALGVGMVLALGVAACGDDDDDGGEASANGLSGTISYRRLEHRGAPTSIAAEEFQGENPEWNVTVGTSGTSGGFEKFCAGETDANDASRQIEPEEKKACSENGVEYGGGPGRQRRPERDRQPEQPAHLH